MPVEGTVITLPGINMDSLWFLFEVSAFILAILYFIFSLIVIRQISLMTESLVTEVSPLLRGLSIIHAGLAVGIVVYFFGIFFL